MNTSDRKIEHLLLCLESDVEAHKGMHGERVTGFEDVQLIHRALPEINKNEIDLSTSFLGRSFRSPLMIASMTGGHPETKAVNAALAGAAEETGIGIGVGSQRAAIENPELEDSFRVVRDAAPHAFVYGNIGAAQLMEYDIEKIERAVEMIGANAMAVHLNFLQEAIQPEGNTGARGCIPMIRKLASELSVPVIVKETGAGISREVAGELCAAGVDAIDVGGLGGTSWAGVETHRALKRGDVLSGHLGNVYWNWGIPTAVSIVECRGDVPVIATGGIRSGLDAAKSIALGASICSIALPLVAPALKGQREVVEKLTTVVEELRVAMFLTGSSSPAALSGAPMYITGRTREMLLQRGFDADRIAGK